MSEALEKAVAALTEKLGGADLPGAAKFAIEGEGAVMVDQNGVAPGDGDADVTITASPDVFAELLAGDLDPTSAYMGGKLKIDGDMGFAMKLAQMLA